MRIIKIEKEKEKEIFTITEKPNWIEWILGKKIEVRKYKYIGDTYAYFSGVRVYVNQVGEIIGATHYITKALENYRRSF